MGGLSVYSKDTAKPRKGVAIAIGVTGKFGLSHDTLVRCAPICPDNTFVASSVAESRCGEHRAFGKSIVGRRERGFGAVGYYETSYCATSSAFNVQEWATNRTSSS